MFTRDVDIWSLFISLASQGKEGSAVRKGQADPIPLGFVGACMVPVNGNPAPVTDDDLGVTLTPGSSYLRIHKTEREISTDELG